MSDAKKSKEEPERGADSGDTGAAPKPPGYFEGESLTRRKLFERGAVTVGGLTGAAVGLPAIGFAVAPLLEEAEARFSDVGSVGEFTPDTYTTKVISVDPGAGESGKTTVYVRKRDDETDPPGTPDFIAISTRCTHLGCTARYVEAAKNFVCPCHTSVFDFVGFRITGPAVRPLDRFDTKVEEGRLLIGPRYSLNEKLQRFSPRDPGEPLRSKFWEVMYPRRFSTAPFNKKGS